VPANLLTLPVADGLIYVQPYYVQSTGAQGYPTLQAVAVAYGDRVGYGTRLDLALTNLFGGGAGNSTTPSGNNTPTTPTTGNGTGTSAAVQALIKQASDAFAAAQKAAGAGDFTAYGADLKQVQDALNALVKAGAIKSTPSPKASPSASTTATPKPTASATAKPSASVIPSASPTK
jgi:uncharacterized membrane protein (UPF0182 family)